MKKILMIAAVALLAVACNKNQAAVKKLDGIWDATSIRYSSGAVSYEAIPEFIESQSFSFDGCKLKDDEWCNTVVTTKYGESTPFIGGETFADSAKYNVTDDGTKLQSKEDLSSTSITSYEIIELSNSSAEFKTTDSDGNVIVTKLAKR